MRLATCALSAILLSGCSWLGVGGGQGDVYGYNSYGYSNAGYGAYSQTAYGGGCGSVQGTQYYTMQTPGCGSGKSYPLGGQGHMGQAGAYGQSGAYGMRGMSGSSYAGSGSAGAAGGGATVLSSQAPYGSAVGGASTGGIAGATSVTNIQGAPIYVPQPYPAYYNAGAPALRGSMQGGGYYGGSGYYGGGYGAMCCGGGNYGGGAMPMGIEASVGTEFVIGGNVFPGVESKPFLGGPGHVSDIAPIGYADAFKEGVNYILAATYDLDPNTTLIGQVGVSKSKGQKLKIGTVDVGGVWEDLSAEFSDLNQVRVEGGLRRYMGHNGYGLRPYVGASAGFVNTEDVTLTQSSATFVDPALFQQTYIRGGWTPTASGIVGAEWQVGPRSALGVETGIRWSDDLPTNIQSDDQWSVPLKIRGRVSF